MFKTTIITPPRIGIKPTIALIREIGTSGAYWIAASADRIVADELSLTGSIGVTSSYLEFEGLLNRYDINYQQISAGKYKELGNPLKELTEEERQTLQEKINKILISNYNFSNKPAYGDYLFKGNFY